MKSFNIGPKLSMHHAPGSTENLWWRAVESAAAGNEAFFEIMNGPNPLTPEEIDKMCDRRPEWERFRGFGAKAIAARQR